MSHRSASSSPSKSPDSAPEVRGSVSDLALALDQQANVISETSTSEISLASLNVQHPEPSTSQDSLSDVTTLGSDDQASEARKAILQSVLDKLSTQPIRRKTKKTKASAPSSPVKASDSSRSLDAKSMERYLLQERDDRLAATAHLRGFRGRPDPRIPRSDIDIINGFFSGGDPVLDPAMRTRRMRFLVRIEDKKLRQEGRRRARSHSPPSDGRREDRGFDWSTIPFPWNTPQNTGNQPSTLSVAAPASMEEPRIPSNWFMPTYTDNQPSTSSAAAPASMEELRIPSNWFMPTYTDNQPSTSAAAPPSAVLAVNYPLTSSVMASNSASSDSVAREGDVEKNSLSENSNDRDPLSDLSTITVWSPDYQRTENLSDENSQRSENSPDENSQPSENSSSGNSERSENSSNENSEPSGNLSDENSQPVENPSDENLQPENPTDRPHEEPQEEAAPIADVNPEVSGGVAVSPVQSEHDESLHDDVMKPPSPKRQRHSEDSS